MVGRWGNFTAEVRAKIGQLEAEYIKLRRDQKLAVAVFVGIFFAANIVFEVSFGPVSQSFLWILLAIATGASLYRFRTLLKSKEKIKAFHFKLDQLVFPKALSLFGMLHEQVVSPEETNVLSILNDSELVTEERNTVAVDDAFELTIDGQSMSVAELDLKNVTGSGKNRHVKHIFHGYLVALELDRRLEGKTFISTEGDTSGFAHRNFWSAITGHEVVETNLEWNEFERLLHVATSNEIETRYVLSTDFMEDLHTWWVKHKENIRISFIGDHMYLLFPDKNVRINDTVSRIDTKELQEYVLTIATPLMHVLHLAEDVKHRF